MATQKNGESSGASTEEATKPAATDAAQRSRLSQEDVPSYSLEQALRVPRAIADSYAYKPTRPLNVAGAMKMTPSSGGFRMLTGAAIAYGLTSGGAFAPEITITPLGMRIVRPTKDGDDSAAKREALLRPKVIGEFLRQYDGAALPSDLIAKNVLLEKGVPTPRLNDVLELIIEGANAVGFLKEISGKKYVDLAGATVSSGKTDEGTPAQPGAAAIGSTAMPIQQVPPVALSVGPGIHINIEIHIAADAAASTIEEIFKNMRRYVLSNNDAADDK